MMAQQDAATGAKNTQHVQRRVWPAAASAVRAAWASTLALCCAPALAADLHVDAFTSDAQGWVGGAAPTYVAGGGAGDGAGFLKISNLGGNLATYNFDSRWTGDFAALGAVRVRVDLMSPAESGPLAMRVVLFGPDTTSERWTSTTAQMVPNDGMWRPYEFSLLAGDLTTPEVVDATYDDLMASVQRVMLRHDPGAPDYGGTGVNGTLGIDNLELAAAPAQPLPGNFDGDNDVDGDDLNGVPLGWRVRFGDDLDGHHFLDWQLHLGETVLASRAANAAVPEPSTLALVLAVAALGTCRRCNQCARS